jgi:hypothetical protein
MQVSFPPSPFIRFSLPQHPTAEYVVFVHLYPTKFVQLLSHKMNEPLFPFIELPNPRSPEIIFVTGASGFIGGRFVQVRSYKFVYDLPMLHFFAEELRFGVPLFSRN